MHYSLATFFFLFGFHLVTLGQNPNPDANLDASIQNEMTTQHLPGVSTVIVKNGKIVWVESYGYADVGNLVPVEDTTIFLLASMSKLFTGTAAMQIHEQGLTDLDTDINTYLPWPVYIPGYESDSITIRELMTHSSSIADGPAMNLYYDYPDPTITLDTCMFRYFSTSGSDYNPSANFYNNAPGTVYNYSNMGTALNGYITQVVTGMPFDDYCKNNIFIPLCMENTAWHFADFDSSNVARPYSYQSGNYVAYPQYGFADYPDGELRTNVMDLANFMIAYLNGGTFGYNSILTAATINDMWTLQVPSLDPTQGLNWYQEEIFYTGGSSMLWGHSGGEAGVSTEMYLDPTNNIGICVLTNGEGNALYVCDHLYNYALSLNTPSGIVPGCIQPNSIEEYKKEDKKIVKIIDFLGRETNYKPNTPLIFIYSDGSAKRIMQIQP